MPLSPSETRSLLARLNHFPKRALGQNFLVDGNIVRKSLDLAQVVAGDAVVEIGPGLGTLTFALLESGAHVWAVERDKALFDYLRSTLMERFPQTLHLLQGDALDHPLAGCNEADTSNRIKVVANLPYAISTPWMDAVLSGPLPSRLVLMLQREAADRYAARHGNKTFGAISIFLQSAYDLAPGHAVSAACFHPRPDVDSFLLHLVRKPTPFLFPAPVKELIRTIFQQRRKQIGSLLRGKLPEDGRSWLHTLSACGLGPQARPEEIPVGAWQQLVQPTA
ncbi:MAG: ribosomal RNA small subunit methyltransferase A [Opitutaceae bacterium]|nr:ribosomal RNA small subunit methyltransferase A [Opitutaceae bacterium]